MYRLFGSSCPYVERGREDKLKTHKFSSENDSIYYAYFQSPLCDKLVKFLPWTLAPNVVTIIGEMCVVLGYGWLCVTYGWDF